MHRHLQHCHWKSYEHGKESFWNLDEEYVSQLIVFGDDALVNVVDVYIDVCVDAADVNVVISSLVDVFFYIYLTNLACIVNVSGTPNVLAALNAGDPIMKYDIPTAKVCGRVSFFFFEASLRRPVDLKRV